MMKKSLLFFLTLLVSVPGWLAAAESVVADSKPNVILIYADDVGYGDLSCYGATKIKTPELDKLAAEGLRFTNAHSAAATCTPSRYSIMTGQYAWRKKGTGILPGDANLILPTDRITLGKLFQNAGYKTGAFGKWHLGLGSESNPLDWNSSIKPGPNEVGFDYSFIFPATADRVPTVYVRNDRVVGLDPADPIMVSYREKVGADYTGKENPELLKMKAAPGHGHDGTIVNGIGRIGWMTGGHRARWTDESVAMDFTQEMEEFLERNTSKPFFVYFATNDIHVPRMPGTRFKGKSGLGYRGDALLQLDYTVGRVMTKLKQLNLDKNTIVIFSSDNGPVLNDGYIDGAVEELNGHVATGPYRGGKYSMLEGGTRLPFIVRWPDGIKPGVSDALVSQVDLLRSLASMTKQNVSADVAKDSQDMWQTFIGADKKGRDSLIVHAKSFAVIKGQWKYIEPTKGPAVLALTNVESGISRDPQLFNLENDLQEHSNLAAENPAVLKELKGILERAKSEGVAE